jgi:hypothetical protein
MPAIRTLSIMKHLLTLLALVIFALHTEAQHLDSLWGDVAAYSFGSNVCIRKSPQLDAPVVGKLQLGEKVMVSHVSSNLTALGGVSFPFVKVHTAQGEEGFVWAGLMAHVTDSNPFPISGSEAFLMVGLVLTGDSSHWALRQVSNGELVKEIPFDGTGLEDHSWCSVDNRSTTLSLEAPEGFDPPMILMSINEGICGCGCYSHTVLHTWDGVSMHYVATLYDEDDVGYANSTFGSWTISYPDVLGDPNHLALVQMAGRHGETEDFSEPVEETTELTMYHWDGHRLKAIPK